MAITAKPEEMDEKKDVVRIPFALGLWTLKTSGMKKTLVSYEMDTDPSGKLPDWIVNSK